MSCSSDETTETEAVSKIITTDDAIINSEIDASVDDVSIIVEDQFSVQQSSLTRTAEPPKSILPLCATVTTVAGTDSYTKTIDFGTVGCIMPNGNVLKGKIIIVFSKNATIPSRSISYTLEGFYHNDKLIEGNKTITHELKSTELLATVHPVTTHFINVKVTFPDGKIYTRVGTRVREMTEGFATIGNWEDNVFIVSGNHITTFPNGSIFTSTIVTPLQFNSSCRIPFAVKGVVEISKNDVEATLDYGNGDCDNLATMTTGAVTKEIELKRKKM
jgi:hypothetical protein